jgi:hypothetical protein
MEGTRCRSHSLFQLPVFHLIPEVPFLQQLHNEMFRHRSAMTFSDPNHRSLRIQSDWRGERMSSQRTSNEFNSKSFSRPSFPPFTASSAVISRTAVYFLDLPGSPIWRHVGQSHRVRQVPRGRSRDC